MKRAKGKLMRRGVRAFTVIELMLAVAIMGVIIYALYSVFNQTQRALRRSETDVDVAQRARAVMEMIGREIEQAQPTHGFWMTNVSSVGRIPLHEINIMGGFERENVPLTQKAADRADIQPRTNYLHNIFFYNNKTNAWQGIGYRVIYVTNGVGVLQRFETNQFGLKPISNRLAQAFVNEPLTNLTYHHVADGVIHLTFVPYDDKGRRLGWDTTNGLSSLNTTAPNDFSSYKIARREATGALIPRYSDVTSGLNDGTNSVNMMTVELTAGYPELQGSQQYVTTFNFRSNALPSYIEMELGMLEPETLEQFYTMVADQNPNATNFLARQITKVHLFRQRIPIRAAAQ
jgi:prepilin-type N-terminal cleavage/methylation domain-containing protein